MTHDKKVTFSGSRKICTCLFNVNLKRNEKKMILCPQAK